MSIYDMLLSNAMGESGGGGGSSGDEDFVKATITLEATGTEHFVRTYYIGFWDTDNSEKWIQTGFWINVLSENEVNFDSNNITQTVTVGTPFTQVVHIQKNKAVYVRTNKESMDFTITGNGTKQVVNGYDTVLVTGDCTISCVGER